MQQNSDAPLIMIGPLLASLAGLIFCAWSAYGNTIDICISAGCDISKDISIGGISLWWFGCAAFALLVILSFSGRPVLGIIVSGACLVADVGFLFLMLLTASCISCLVVAILFALSYSAFRHANNTFDLPVPRSWLVLFWLLFFIANVGSVVRENMLPWAIHKTENSTVNVYFSPTCPSCLDAVAALNNSASAAFFPIAKNDQDLALIALMQDNLEKGHSPLEAITLARQNINTAATQGIFSNIILKFRTLINSSYLARNGIEVVPVIEYKGLPGFLAPRSGSDTSYKAPLPLTVHSPTPMEKPKKEEDVQADSAGSSADVSADAPVVMGRIPKEQIQISNDSSPEHIMGNGAFTYKGGADAGNFQNNGNGGALPFDTGVVGACGGIEPCPE